MFRILHFFSSSRHGPQLSIAEIRFIILSFSSSLSLAGSFALFHQRIKMPQIKLCPVWGFCRVFIIWTSFADISVDNANIKSQTAQRYQTMKTKPLIKFTAKFYLLLFPWWCVDMLRCWELRLSGSVMTASVFDCLKFSEIGFSDIYESWEPNWG